MKVVIIGDIHLGASFAFGRPDAETGISSRLLDYEKTLAHIITYVITQKIELCIMLGDIFETRNPSPQQVVIFYRQLKRLSDAGITSYVLMGNHDYVKTRKITSSLDPLKEIHLPRVSIFTDITLNKFVDSNGEKVNVLMMPYRNRQSYDKNLNDEAINELVKELTLAKKDADSTAPTLLCGHMMMEGTIPSDAGEYGINELVLPFNAFSGIDVVINGHIHRASILKEDPVFIYSGSMECKDFSEKDHKKCFLIYDTNKKGIESVAFEPLDTRKFVDFELDYSANFPADPTAEVLKDIASKPLEDMVVRLNVKVPETKISSIDVTLIRKAFYDAKVSYISDISVSPVIFKQLRNQKINEAPDDISAFKHYIASQTNIEDGILQLGLAIMTAEIEG